MTTIGPWVFNGCFGLTNLTIPDSVKEIKENAFKGCLSLKEVNIKHPELLKDASLGEDVKIIVSK